MIIDVRTGKQPPSSSKDNNMVSKFEDNPPAYHDDRSESQALSSNHVLPSSELVSSPSNPPPSVDQVHIYESKQNIQGTFFIDPLIPVLDRRKMKAKSKQPLPHASFRSRKGEVDIELATTGSIEDAPKANVAVSTRHGDIKIKLLPMPPSRPRIGLDVQSRHGNISLFIPEGFSGVIHVSTRKGEMHLLPALLACSKVVKSSDNEKIFMIGTQNNLYELDPSREASFCDINSRKGNIIVGLSGRDYYTPQVGFWKRLFSGSGKERSTIEKLN